MNDTNDTNDANDTNDTNETNETNWNEESGRFVLVKELIIQTDLFVNDPSLLATEQDGNVLGRQAGK